MIDQSPFLESCTKLKVYNYRAQRDLPDTSNNAIELSMMLRNASPIDS